MKSLLVLALVLFIFSGCETAATSSPSDIPSFTYTTQVPPNIPTKGDPTADDITVPGVEWHGGWAIETVKGQPRAAYKVYYTKDGTLIAMYPNDFIGPCPPGYCRMNGTV